MHTLTRYGLVALVCAATTWLTDCFVNGSGETGDGAAPDAGLGDGGVLPFQADPPFVYVAKVKNILVGLPATQDEINQVAVAPDQPSAQQALQALIKGWMQLPQFEPKMERFFQLAFQQVQISDQDVDVSTVPKYITTNTDLRPYLMNNIEESFAKTMFLLSSSNQPFNQAASTTTFAMTTALMEFYGYLDALQIDDNGAQLITRDGAVLAIGPMLTKQPNCVATRSCNMFLTSTQNTLTQSADPSDPSTFMYWYNAGVATQGCSGGQITMPLTAFNLHYAMTGAWDSTFNCNALYTGSLSSSLLTTSGSTNDFNDWRLVTIQQSSTPSAWTQWWNLPALRAIPTGGTLTYRIPRVGFFTTPAFFANWQTNQSNVMRVTMNQTFIVALGAQVDGTDPTTLPMQDPPGLDTVHANPMTGACYGCHKLLDPSKGPLSATYSWLYHLQDLDQPYDPPDAFGWPQSGGFLFAFQNEITPTNSLQDLGNALKNHPLFANAWVQKFCLWSNSVPCASQDVSQIVSDFQNGYNWNQMVTELLSSPAITNAVLSATASTYGEVVAVARRDHWCAALNNRLGFPDVCGLSGFTSEQFNSTVTSIANGLPSDGYGRGSVLPNLPTHPNLFSFAATQDICEQVSTVLVDAPTTGPKCVYGSGRTTPCYWASDNQTDVANAINDFVQIMMTIEPGDPRYTQAISLITAQYNRDVASGVSTTTALQSAFAAACQAASAVSIGM